MYRVGELDEKITIERESYIDDGMGGRDVVASVVRCNIWAKVRPLSGKEVERFDKLNTQEMALFVIRYDCSIMIKDRILFDGFYYNIRNIPRRGSRAMYTEMYAERGVAL